MHLPKLHSVVTGRWPGTQGVQKPGGFWRLPAQPALAPALAEGRMDDTPAALCCNSATPSRSCWLKTCARPT